jgi:hypothetical protein
MSSAVLLRPSPPPLAARRRDSGRAASTSGRGTPAAPQLALCRRRAAPDARVARGCCTAAAPSLGPIEQGSTGAEDCSRAGIATNAVGASGPGAQQHAPSGSSATDPAAAAAAATAAAPFSSAAEALSLLALAAAAMPPGPAAAAEEVIKYNAAAGEGLIKGLSGFLYIGLLGFFLFRTFNRRARQAREEVRRRLTRAHGVSRAPLLAPSLACAAVQLQGPASAACQAQRLSPCVRGGGRIWGCSSAIVGGT